MEPRACQFTFLNARRNGLRWKLRNPKVSDAHYQSLLKRIRRDLMTARCQYRMLTLSTRQPLLPSTTNPWWRVNIVDAHSKTTGWQFIREAAGLGMRRDLSKRLEKGNTVTEERWMRTCEYQKLFERDSTFLQSPPTAVVQVVGAQTMARSPVAEAALTARKLPLSHPRPQPLTNMPVNCNRLLCPSGRSVRLPSRQRQIRHICRLLLLLRSSALFAAIWE
mmetsp:Transcript_4018/g.7709  ORF Transcript_4018/g.7709 Transcript_4018/m.7709 type:complete len:221 (-) Transcript_4018:336-998(-)